MRSSLLPVVSLLLAVPVCAQSGSAIVVAGRAWGFPLGPMAPRDTPLAAPNGLAVGPDGTIYVADQIASVVVAIKNGVSRRFAGNGGAGYEGDGGPAERASLNGPGPLAVGHDGSVYIADLWNYAIRRVAPNGTISTVAGNGVFGACADGAAATGPCVGNTGGVAVDSGGNLYFSDSSAAVYRVASGKISKAIGGASQQVFYPEALAIDGRDNLYILQSLNAGVVRVSPTGDISHLLAGNNTPAGMTSIAVSADGTLYAAYGICHVLKATADGTVTDLGAACSAANGFGIDQRAIAVDGQGRVYVADDATQTVRQIATDGTVSTFAGNNRWYYSPDGAPADTVALGGITSDFLSLPSGDMLIAGGGRIRRMSPDGRITTVVEFGAYDPVSLALAPNGNVMFADSLNCRIQQLDSSGHVSLFAGRGACVDDSDGAPASQAGLSYPRALAYDRFGNLYVATSGGIRKIDTTNVVSTFAGSGGSPFADNVPATQTSLDARALAFDAGGDLLVGDFLNHRIRSITPSGVITTLAGNGNFNTGGDDGPALSHPVGLVWSMAVDPSGNVWFSDGTYLRRLGTDGFISTIHGSSWGCPSCLLHTGAVRVNGSTVYAADWPVILRLAAGVHKRERPRPCASGCAAAR